MPVCCPIVFAYMLKKGKPTEAVLNIDFALRDRDYIKSTVGHPPGDLKLIVGFMNRGLHESDFYDTWDMVDDWLNFSRDCHVKRLMFENFLS